MANPNGPVQKDVRVVTVDPLSLCEGDTDLERDAETGLPKQLKAYKVRTDPEMLIVPHFLSDADMDHMIAEADKLWEPSFVQVGENKKPQVSRDRTSYSCTFEPALTSKIRDIEARLAGLAGLPLECLEQLALVRYQPGQHFGQHHDGENRPKTVFVYLNDLPDDAGGETIFPELGLQVRPRRGCAVVWSNTLENGQKDMRLVHAGLPPKNGIKYGVNCFFHHKPLKIRGAVDGEDPLGGQNHQKLREEDEEKGPLATVDPATFDAVAGQLMLFTVNVQPKLSIVPNFISDTEASSLINFSENLGWNLEPADEQLLSSVVTRISSIAGEPVPDGGFKMAKCISGVLPDGLFMTGNEEYCQRFGTKTVMIFLNEMQDDQAGELRFPRIGLQVRPRLGCAVMWSTEVDGQQDLRTAHQGRKLNYGMLHTAFCTFSRVRSSGGYS